jgi:hypothetical protein
VKRTITLEDVVLDGSWCIRFDDKNFGTSSPEDLESYSYDVLQDISGQLLRSLLFIEYMKSNNLNISATIDTDDPSGIWVKLDV